MAELEVLIREIAARHSIVVSRDDPLLILQTLNEYLLTDSAKAHEKLLQQHREALEALAARWEVAAGARADQSAKAILDSARDALQGRVAEAVSEAGRGLRQEMEFSIRQYRAAVAQARRLAWLNLVAAALTLAAAGLVGWVAAGIRWH
jgi:hypothetical protein